MKFPDYQDETIKIISNVGKIGQENSKQRQIIENLPVVYLGTSLVKNLN